MLDWHELILKSDEELAMLDIVAVHQACASGLPNAHGITIRECVQFVDYCAEVVRPMTMRMMPKFFSYLDFYRNSEAFFRLACMVTALQRDLGIYACSKLSDNPDMSDSNDVFLHGLVRRFRGSCSNMPILYAGIGRRLGYPLKLVYTEGHQFCRWCGKDGERINLECTCPGFSTPPDDYYVTDLAKVTPERVRKNRWMVPCSPREELASFLNQRGGCLRDNRQFAEATDACLSACHVSQRNPFYVGHVNKVLRKWTEHIATRLPPTFPEVRVHLPPSRRFPPHIPSDTEEHLITNETYQALLDDEEQEQMFWRHLRCNLAQWPAHVPKRIQVTRHYKPDISWLIKG